MFFMVISQVGLGSLADPILDSLTVGAGRVEFLREGVRLLENRRSEKPKGRNVVHSDEETMLSRGNHYCKKIAQ